MKTINLLALSGGLTAVSSYAVYTNVMLYFLPVWKGGNEDKTLVSLCLFFGLLVFLISLETLMTISLSSITRAIYSPEKINISSFIKKIKIATLPLKICAYFLSMNIFISRSGLAGGLTAVFFVSYLYFYFMPYLNKRISGKIMSHNNYEKISFGKF